MSDCEKIREKLYSFVIGECDAETETAIRRHIGRCRRCSEELKRMRYVYRLMGTLGSVKPSYDLYPSVAARIRPYIFWLKVASMAGVAALFLILLFSAFITPDGETPPAREAEKSQEETEWLVGKTTEEPHPVPEREFPPRREKEERVTETAPPETGKGEEEVVETPVKEEKVTVPEKEKERKVAELPERKKEKTERPSPKESKTSVSLARVGEMKGRVRLRSGGEERLLGSGAVFSVAPGDVLITEDTGQVRLDLEGGGYLYINRGAEVEFLEEEDEVVLKLIRGEMFFEREENGDAPLFAVDTGFGRVRSRKARFALRKADKDSFFIQVFKGEAEFIGREKKRKRKLRGAFHLMRDRCEAVISSSIGGPPWASGLRPRRPPHPLPLKILERFDADGDGKLSLDELKAMVEERMEEQRKRRPEGMKPPAGRMPPPPSPERILERFDADGDGALSLEELKVMMKEMRKHERERPFPEGGHPPHPPRPKGRGAHPPPFERNQGGRR